MTKRDMKSGRMTGAGEAAVWAAPDLGFVLNAMSRVGSTARWWSGERRQALLMRDSLPGSTEVDRELMAQSAPAIKKLSL